MADERRVYVEDPRFAKRRDEERRDAPVTVVYQDGPRRGCFRSCFSGCLMFAGILFIVQFVVIWLLWRNWRDVASAIGSEAVKASLGQADLPEAEKAELGVEIDRLAAAFREGRISPERAGAIMQRIIASPLATSIIVSIVEAKYLDRSGLTEQEMIAGRTTLARFARGVLDNKFPEARLDATLKLMATKDSDGAWQLKERVTDDELRAFLAAAKADADAAQIPEQPEVVDPSEELKKIIDDALGDGTGFAPILRPEA